jgi:hypothetical protein
MPLNFYFFTRQLFALQLKAITWEIEKENNSKYVTVKINGRHPINIAGHFPKNDLQKETLNTHKHGTARSAQDTTYYIPGSRHV